VWTRYRKTRLLPETVGAPALCSTDPADVTVRLARSKIACAVSCQHYHSCNSFNQNCQDDSCSCDLYTCIPHVPTLTRTARKTHAPVIFIVSSIVYHIIRTARTTPVPVIFTPIFRRRSRSFQTASIGTSGFTWAW